MVLETTVEEESRDGAGEEGCILAAAAETLEDRKVVEDADERIEERREDAMVSINWQLDNGETGRSGGEG